MGTEQGGGWKALYNFVLCSSHSKDLLQSQPTEEEPGLREAKASPRAPRPGASAAGTQTHTCLSPSPCPFILPDCSPHRQPRASVNL